MLCEAPFVKDGSAYGCGRCAPCRNSKASIWATRIMLEALSYSDNAFITLTYDDEHLPKINGNETVLPEHLNLFLKRLRYHYEGYQRKIYKELRLNEPFEEYQKLFRFYAVAEYGGTFGRPHYHAILFNFPTCLRGRTRRDHGSGAADYANCCEVCLLVGRAWGKGIVEVGTVERGSAQYVCENYVTKGLRRNDDIRLRPGQHPEFSRMSRMPGIGQPSLWEYADAILSHDGVNRLPDVPNGIRVGKNERGIGRYLRQSLRAFVGRERNAPQATLDALKEEMQPLREAAFNNSQSFKEVVVQENTGKRLNHLARKSIFKQKGSL